MDEIIYLIIVQIKHMNQEGKIETMKNNLIVT